MSNEVYGVYSGIAHMKEDKDLEQIKGGGVCSIDEVLVLIGLPETHICMTL